ncbi:hypothetical protein F4808DRAFT_443938 [Astrocystis sublimbata]|nr:hypothetical protein F4808DRAFT_443938 [Astrocystis sublimbata]
MSRTLSLVRQCANCYPILESLLVYLSASEATLFTTLIGLRHHAAVKNVVDRFASIYRDMPELFAWMSQMLSKGHSVWLAGGGLTALYARIETPLRYWSQGRGTDTIRLWVVVKASAADQELARRRRLRPSTYYALTEDEDVVWSHTPQMKELRRAGKLTYSNMVPIPGAFPDHRLGDRKGWLKSDVLSNHGIETVCYVGRHEEQMGESLTPDAVPIFEVCPMAHGKEHPATICCAELGPGATYSGSVRAHRRTSETFIVPYIDVGYTLAADHPRSAAGPPQRLHRSHWDESLERLCHRGSATSLQESHEFFVKLRCPDFPGDLNRDYQVVCRS